jgi:predicted RNase H-like nuclease
MRWAGVDGCKGGWIAVVIDEAGAHEHRFLKRADEMAGLEAERILIDIPIGLPESGRRASDIAARKMLGAAWPRLFVDVRRPLLEFADYAAANEWARTDGNGISRQLWNILPKIAEVDRFMRPELQTHILEAHPELAFARLRGGDVIREGKKTPKGFAIRARLLRQAGLGAIGKWVSSLSGRAAADDLLDAAALALAARAPVRVACAGETDARGLAMDIWY